jgi:hypothetical protein
MTTSSGNLHKALAFDHLIFQPGYHPGKNLVSPIETDEMPWRCNQKDISQGHLCECPRHERALGTKA